MIEWGMLSDTTATSWFGRLVWGAPGWLVPAAVAGIFLLIAVLWTYRRAGASAGVRTLAGTLKTIAIIAIALCVVEPLWMAVRPRPGANLFLVVADNSESLNVRDRPGGKTRGETMRSLLVDETPWLVRLGQDFELRRYFADSQLRPTETFQALTLSGDRSMIAATLGTIGRQFRGRPVAGVLLLTDGNATDWDDSQVDWSGLPPVYPVVIGEDQSPRDVSVSKISVSQTNFESLPVTIQAEVATQGIGRDKIVLKLLDESGHEVQRQVVTAPAEDKPLTHTFQLRPETSGVTFYDVCAVTQSEESLLSKGSGGREATLVNNKMVAMVDRGRGPYRVLYVSGRPNWDFKFLRRAVEEDAEIELVGLVRIAKKEPRFTFRGRTGETTNPLFRGFTNQKDENAEQYDQPVIVRIGAKDENELRDGFPKTADELFAYHAVILDDVEAEYFSRDQMALIQQFVSQRGGALLMSGGQESFGGGDYARTPIGELLPVYVDRAQPAPALSDYRLALTREGWLQPWVRLRTTEPEEEKRLAEMPAFRTWNSASSLKPGATVLIQAIDEMEMERARNNSAIPALVTQKFGNGQCAALLVGDLWRWEMHRESNRDSDLSKLWRQLVRWLVSNVPRRVEVASRRRTEGAGQGVEFRVNVRSESYLPQDNAEVNCRIKTPDGKTIDLRALPVGEKSGVYACDYVPRVPGPYHVSVSAKAEDESDIGTCETGIVHEPTVDEFRQLRPNRELLQSIAQRTQGEVIHHQKLDEFVSSIPNRKIPITEPWIYPLWHQWPVLGLAVLCLVGEWGVRRWKGLP